MKQFSLRKFVLYLTIATSGALCISAQALPQGRVVDDVTYNKVLDLAFASEDPTPHKTIYSFTLRFKPSSQPELQMVIRRKFDSVQVVTHGAKSGIFTELNTRLNAGTPNRPEELARNLEVLRSEGTLHVGKLRELRREFITAIDRTLSVLRTEGEEFDKSGGETMLLDGAFYTVEYSQRLNHFKLDVYDVDLSDVTDAKYQLTRWMDKVRRYIRIPNAVAER